MSDETTPRQVYTTRHEAIEREIIGAFAAEQGAGADYDIDGIADEVLEWHVDRDEQGREIATEGHIGYRVRELTDAEFWEVAARHPRSQWTQADIADRLGLTQGHVRVLRHRGQLPEPSGVLGVTPWWSPETIEPWLEQWERDRDPRADHHGDPDYDKL